MTTPLWSSPLWKQLAILWLATVLLDGLLLYAGRPAKVFWLIPYPTWRSVTPMIGQLFRASPRLGFALTLPVVALLATVGLCIARAVARR